MKRALSPFVLALLLAACGSQGEVERLKAENQQLKGRIADLQSALDEERTGPAKLLARARGEMDSGKLDAAQATLDLLQKRHPASREANEARTLVDSIRANLEKANKEEEKHKREAAARMKTSVDEVRGITWYKDRETPVLGTYVTLYFGDFKASGLGPLRLKAQYQSDDWLFVVNMVVKADEQVFPLKLGEWKRDNSSGAIWEWADVEVDADLLKVLRAMLAAKKVTVRFNGDKYYRDHVLTTSERSSMNAVITAYANLGGRLPT